MDTIIIKEYDQLQIREKRNIARNEISKDDALALQSIIMDDAPIFKWGYKKLIAQHWVGTISLKDLNIEILPKLFGHVGVDELRMILMRMLTVSHQSPSTHKIPGMVQVRKNSLIEMLIDTFLDLTEKYVKEGLQHAYKKIDANISQVKGRILFGKQFSQNVLDPTKFYCRYSKFTEDNIINRFIKLCLNQMFLVSVENQNKTRIKYLLPIFDGVENITKDKALAKPIVFNSINYRVEEIYRYGMLFLNNLFCTLSAGNTSINLMLFDMNNLYELFIFRVSRMAFGKNVIYQKRGNYLLERERDGKMFVGLRPDITIKRPSGVIDIVDTKWKIPQNFAKESDIYQMNAYSSSIENVDRIILLYPSVSNDSMISNYYFVDTDKKTRNLSIRTIDLSLVLNWKVFIKTFQKVLA